jgi:hypothetical protein
MSATTADSSPAEQSWFSEFFSLLTEVEPLGTFATNSPIENMPVLCPQVDVGFPFVESGLSEK